MSVKIATWNINSVRLRINLVADYLKSHQPDILCLQEIKCANDQFPAKAFNKLGYEYHAVNGQKAYHGVATVSRIPLEKHHCTDYCEMGDARHVATPFTHNGHRVLVHNFYVPAGGDEADTEKNPKFAHKLQFIEEMRALKAVEDDVHAVLVGDLNIAPHENDVWSHKQLLKVVSHTPVETDGLTQVFEAGGWSDLVRNEIPESEKIFSWWSYRARDWDASDRGRRLDHIWASPELAEKQVGLNILREARGWTKPSDHVPIMVELDL